MRRRGLEGCELKCAEGTNWNAGIGLICRGNSGNVCFELRDLVIRPSLRAYFPTFIHALLAISTNSSFISILSQ